MFGSFRRPDSTVDLETLSKRFLQFADAVFGDASPLYRRLSIEVSTDHELLTLAAGSRQGQPEPLLLFGAVQYLLMEAPERPLADYYPALASDLCGSDPSVAFREYCLSHASEIERLISCRAVQTNEVRRCACLAFAFDRIARRWPRQRIALIEIGASAGLNLFPDRYAYDYGCGSIAGRVTSPVLMTCEIRGKSRPPLPPTFPDMESRLGIDLEPIDLNDPEAVRWLRALVWPEARDRAELLARAIDCVRAWAPQVMAGDGLALLPIVLASTPDGILPCVLHTFVMNQIATPDRPKLGEILSTVSESRPVVAVSIESVSWPPVLEIRVYCDGSLSTEQLAQCDPHGRWIHWISEEGSTALTDP